MVNKTRIIIITLITVVVAFVLSWAASIALISQSSNTIPDQTMVMVGGAVVSVAVADTLPLQTKGLSDIALLPDGHGMLFVFPDKQIRNFWMKFCNF